MAQSSTIDAYVADLGVKSDAEIAKLAGVTISAVYQYRHARGIGVVRRSTTKDAPRTAKGAAKPLVEPKAATRNGRSGPVSALDAHLHLLGVLADVEVAQRVGITRAAVAKYRLRHDIPSAGGTSKGTRRTAPAAPVAVKETAAPAALQPRPGPTSPVDVNTKPSGVMCWRITLADGGVTHLAARSVERAANKAHAAVGDSAVGLALLGSMYP